MANDKTTLVTAGRATRRQLLGGAGLGIGVALTGCITNSETDPVQSPEATLTVRLHNRDQESRTYTVAVNQGDSLTNSFSGVLSAAPSEPAEMVATVRATDEQHDFTITTTDGQRGQTWDPTECGDFLVDAVIEAGTPAFETECRSQ